jgi:hypothetical protein
MAEVDITVVCQASGQTADFEYDNDVTLTQFIKDLQQQGMAWAPGGSLENRGVSVDGEQPVWMLDRAPHPFDMAQAEGATLADIGVKSGVVITILDDVSVCGPGSLPITFLHAGGVINYPSPNWSKELWWTAGDHEPIEDLICRSVLPKDVNYSSVYVTLHAHDNNGKISTLFRNRCLEEMVGKTQIMFQNDVQLNVCGWLCFLSSKPQRLGE